MNFEEKNIDSKITKKEKSASTKKKKKKRNLEDKKRLYTPCKNKYSNY
jgi:hypothetical protein